MYCFCLLSLSLSLTSSHSLLLLIYLFSPQSSKRILFCLFIITCNEKVETGWKLFSGVGFIRKCQLCRIGFLKTLYGNSKWEILLLHVGVGVYVSQFPYSHTISLSTQSSLFLETIQFKLLQQFQDQAWQWKNKRVVVLGWGFFGSLVSIPNQEEFSLPNSSFFLKMETTFLVLQTSPSWRFIQA